jgi:glycosyltransferase involved in cell wall biosynthesis
MKKLLYVCEAVSGGIMEYAIRHSAAIASEGVEVHFLCKPSFPTERLGTGMILERFQERRGARGESRRLVGKLSTILRLTLGQRRNAKQVVELATKLAQTSSTQNPLPITRQIPGSAEVVVLFACYKEYFSPFWVGPLKRLARRGLVIGTIAHDPVRDFVVGPLWWHRWSVRLGYSFVRDVFVHDATPVDFGGEKPNGIRIHQIPHGPYEVAEPKIGRLEMRRRLGFNSGLTTELTENTERLAREAWPRLCPQAGASEPDSLPSKLADAPASASLNRSAIGPASSPATSHSPPFTAPEASSASLPATPASPDFVFLAFGQIRDGKNLDLFLRAMTRLPENVKLLVAGKGDSGASRPAEYYQKLAEELGVADRCRWDIRRIPDEEVGDIFAACDVVLLTYSAKFRSASGVLNAAVSARKPVLASSGPGPLKSVVNKYNLGLFVEPDNLEAVLRGAKQLLNSLSSPSTQTLATSDSPHDTAAFLLPAWDRYECDNSWEKNVKIISSFLWSPR